MKSSIFSRVVIAFVLCASPVAFAEGEGSAPVSDVAAFENGAAVLAALKAERDQLDNELDAFQKKARGKLNERVIHARNTLVAARQATNELIRSGSKNLKEIMARISEEREIMRNMVKSSPETVRVKAVRYQTDLAMHAATVKERIKTKATTAAGMGSEFKDQLVADLEEVQAFLSGRIETAKKQGVDFVDAFRDVVDHSVDLVTDAKIALAKIALKERSIGERLTDWSTEIGRKLYRFNDKILGREPGTSVREAEAARACSACAEANVQSASIAGK